MNMNSDKKQLKYRTTTIISFSELVQNYKSNISLVTPIEQLQIKIKTGRNPRKIDFGALAYFEREHTVPRERNQNNKSLKVNLESFCQDRATALEKILTGWFNEASLGGSERGINTKINDFRKFLCFADERQLYDVLTELTYAKESLSNYHAYLHSEERKKDYNCKTSLSGSTISSYISAAKEALLCTLDVEEPILTEDIDLTTYHTQTNQIRTPDDEQFNLVVQNTAFIFKTFYEVAVHSDNKNKPLIKFPVPLTFTNEENTRLFFPLRQVRTSNPKGINYINYITGEFESFETLRKMNSNLQYSMYEETIENYKIKLSDANQSIIHPERFFAGEVACRSFNILFQATVGANNNHLCKFIIDPNLLNEDLQRMGFESWKGRKGTFSQYQFGPFFYKNFFIPYLELRKKLLGEKQNEFDLLLFRLQKDGAGNIFFGEDEYPLPIKQNDRILSESFNFLNNTLAINLPSLSVSALRALKSERTYEQFDEYVASIINQNSVETTRKHYIAGTQKKHFIDLHNFFKLKPYRNTKRVKKPTNYGCSERTNPSILEGISVEQQVLIPNCRNEISCYICKYFEFFPDDIDVRKILEHKFIIENYYKQLTNNLDHFNHVYENTLKIINFLANGVKSFSKNHKKMVNDIEQEIFVDLILSTFITSKIETLYAKRYLPHDFN